MGISWGFRGILMGFKGETVGTKCREFDHESKDMVIKGHKASNTPCLERFLIPPFMACRKLRTRLLAPFQMMRKETANSSEVSSVSQISIEIWSVFIFRPSSHGRWWHLNASNLGKWPSIYSLFWNHVVFCWVSTLRQCERSWWGAPPWNFWVLIHPIFEKSSIDKIWAVFKIPVGCWL